MHMSHMYRCHGHYKYHQSLLTHTAPGHVGSHRRYQSTLGHRHILHRNNFHDLHTVLLKVSCKFIKIIIPCT